VGVHLPADERRAGNCICRTGTFTFAPECACGGGRSAEWVYRLAALRGVAIAPLAKSVRRALGVQRGKAAYRAPPGILRSRHGASICKMVWVPSWHRPRRSSQARGRRLPPRRARTSLFADLGRRRGRGPRREVHVHRYAGRRVGPIRLGRHTTRGSRRRSISASSSRLPSKRQGLGAPSVPPRTWTGFASCARPHRCSHNQSGAGRCAP
jgi:hypothetical protein